jgi:hypothetical protein
MPPKKTKTAKSASEEKKSKKTSKKKLVKKKATDTKKTNRKKPAKIVSVDVISDNEENLEIIDNNQEDLNQVDIENLDSQKKYYSELISEIKEKQKNFKEEDYNKKQKSIKLYRRIVFNFLFLVIIFILIVAYFTSTKLIIAIAPAAELVSDSVQFEVISNLEAETSLTSTRVVPGEIIDKKISSEKIYFSSGEEKIGEEVTGQVIIYNNYSQSQPLIATTRLLTDDQKLFRISEGVTVPAGSSVRVMAYADEVSSEMAIGPSKMTIPGLWAGLQDQIYAENPEPFEYKSKLRHFVRQGDIDLATNDIRQTIKNKLEQEINWQIRPGDGIAYDIDENKSLLTIDAKLGDEVEKFNVKAENRAIIVRFSKEKAEELLRAKLSFSLSEKMNLSSFNSEQIEYRLDDYDLETGIAKITANFSGSAILKEKQDFIDKNKLTNLSQAQIEYYLNTYPEIADFELKFFPRFLKRAPHLSDRIEIIIKN